MMDIDILKEIKTFLEQNVASKIKLEKPQEEGVFDGRYELVNPQVFIGWIPPKNFIPDNYDIPSILVMSDGGEDDFSEASVNIRLTIGTYDPGTTKDEGIDINCKGYKDILNIIAKIRLALSHEVVINNCGPIQQPITWGMYEEQNYPYWHGYMQFKVSSVPLKFNVDKYL